MKQIPLFSLELYNFIHYDKSLHLADKDGILK